MIKAGMVGEECRSRLNTSFFDTSSFAYLSAGSSNTSSPWQYRSPVPSDTASSGSAATLASSDGSIDCGDQGQPQALVRRAGYHNGRVLSLNLTSSARPLLHLTRHPNPLVELSQVSDLEVHCYSFFRHNTVPRLTTYFENCIWRHDLESAALAVHHPVIFKAVAALGAVHRRFCYGISREAFEYCAHAARLYESAVKTLENFKLSKEGQMDYIDSHVISACEAALGIFQSFQADTDASSTHIHTGVQHAIKRPLRLLHSESWYYAKPSPPRIICGITYQLYCRATELCGEPAFRCSMDNYVSPKELTIPAAFENLKEMKDYLFSIVEEVWRRHRCVEDWLTRRIFLGLYENYLHDWTSACLKTLESGMVIDNGKIFNLLNMMHSTLCVSIQGNMLTTDRPEMKPVPHLPIFEDDEFSEIAAELIRAVDYMYTIKNADLSHVKSIIERAASRHQIFSFEQRAPREPDSRVDEILNLWTIAKQVSEVEENAVIVALKDILPPGAICVDIGDMWRKKGKATVRYYEPHPDQQGYRWVQQFWSF